MECIKKVRFDHGIEGDVVPKIDRMGRGGIGLTQQYCPKPKA